LRQRSHYSLRSAHSVGGSPPSLCYG